MRQIAKITIPGLGTYLIKQAEGETIYRMFYTWSEYDSRKGHRVTHTISAGKWEFYADCLSHIADFLRQNKFN